MSSKTKTTATKEEASLALVPKLRFPEFRDAGGWREGRITDIAEVLQGYGFPERYQGQTTVEYPFYKVSDISNTLAAGKVFIEESANYITEDVLKELKAKPIPEGTTIFAKIGEAIRSNRRAITTKPCLIDNNAAGVKRIQGKSTDLFVYYTMETISLIEYSGGVVPSVNKSAIENIAVKFPAIGEQQKIAECLSSVDELIAAQARKLDALKTHKKGLMQQLFPREGETQPRLRFPEFQNAGEWEGGVLGSKTTKVGSGITPNGGDKNYKQSGRPFVRSQNVGWGELILDDVAFIDEETHSSFSSTEIQVLDVLLNITGASIGRSAVADGRIAGGNVNQHVCVIRVKAAELNHFYLNQYLISPEGQKQIDSFQAGGNRQGLNFAQIRSFTIPLPPKVSEQQRIADCLTSLDDLIAAQTQKLVALKTHKKGLMQQLFPSPEEVEA
jgi:type I restriction enzyme S subunit